MATSIVTGVTMWTHVMKNKLICFFFGHHIMSTVGNEGGDGIKAKLYNELWCKRCKKSWGKNYMVTLFATEKEYNDNYGNHED